MGRFNAELKCYNNWNWILCHCLLPRNLESLFNDKYLQLNMNSSFFYRSSQLEYIENICSSDWFPNNYFRSQTLKILFHFNFLNPFSISSAVKILKRHTFLSFSFITWPQKCVWSFFLHNSETTLTSQPIMVIGTYTYSVSHVKWNKIQNKYFHFIKDHKNVQMLFQDRVNSRFNYYWLLYNAFVYGIDSICWCQYLPWIFIFQLHYIQLTHCVRNVRFQ